jgi:peptidoglycan-N-acetylglucosamine deacetylase
MTFDAEHPDRPRCPPRTVEGILDVLARERVRATFFLQGRWARAYPGTATRIVAGGHVVGSHSFFHARMPLLSDEGLAYDVAEAARAIEENAGVDPRPWFRCPWADGAGDHRVRAALTAAGFRHAGWDVVGEDWEETRSAEQVELDVVEGVLAFTEGAVALLHTWPASALESLPVIIRRLREAGAEFVTVEALAKRDLGATRNPLVASNNPRR